MFEVYEQTRDLFDRPAIYRLCKLNMRWLKVPFGASNLLEACGYADGLVAADVAKKRSASALCNKTMVVKVENKSGKIQRSVVKYYENGKLAKTHLVNEGRMLGN